MTVRAAGLQVLLQPLAVVYHQEGTTFGTDSSSSLKRQLITENRAKFVHKWGSVLQVGRPGHLVAAAWGLAVGVTWRELCKRRGKGSPRNGAGVTSHVINSCGNLGMIPMGE